MIVHDKVGYSKTGFRLVANLGGTAGDYELLSLSRDEGSFCIIG